MARTCRNTNFSPLTWNPPEGPFHRTIDFQDPLASSMLDARAGQAVGNASIAIGNSDSSAR